MHGKIERNLGVEEEEKKLGNNIIMDSFQEAEWRKAQAMHVSCDLVAAAKQLLVFLASVDRYPCLYQGPAVEQSIRRYEYCWLPLLAGTKAETKLVPPFDCEWVWHCHRLNPLQYSEDCKRLYGRVLDAAVVPPSQKDFAMSVTAKLWEDSYPEEPFALDLDVFCSATNNYRDYHHMRNSKIQYDLARAMRRQRSFWHQASLPHMSDDRFLRAAEERYKGYLYLIKKSKSIQSFYVPTYDIELVWHSHQLNLVAYVKDTVELLGKLLQHHQDINTDSLRGHGQAFSETTKEWERTFGRRYLRAGAMHRENLVIPSSSTCQMQFGDTQQSVQLMLEVVRARHMKEDNGSLFVRYYIQSAAGTVAMNTRQVLASSHPEWREASSVDCFSGKRNADLVSKLRSEYLVFEVRWRSGSSLLGSMRGSKLIGRVRIAWKELLESASLSMEKWFPLVNERKLKLNDSCKPPSLHLALSITPPVAAIWSSIRPSPPLEKRRISHRQGTKVSSVPSGDRGCLGENSFAMGLAALSVGGGSSFNPTEWGV